MSLISCDDCWICCEPCAAKCMHPDREEHARATGPNWTCNRRFPEDIPPAVEAMWKDLVIEQVDRAQDKRDHEAALATVAREATGAMLMSLNISASSGVDHTARKYHAVMDGHLTWNPITKLWEKK